MSAIALMAGEREVAASCSEPQYCSCQCHWLILSDQYMLSDDDTHILVAKVGSLIAELTNFSVLGFPQLIVVMHRR